MAMECRDPSARRQRAIRREVQKAVSQVDSMHFFNLLTSPELLDELEALLPEHRERRYPPTVALAMFLGQVLSADGSCQNAVSEAPRCQDSCRLCCSSLRRRKGVNHDAVCSRA